MGALGIAALGCLFLGGLLGLGTVGAFTDERRQIGRSMQALRAIGDAPMSMKQDLDKPFSQRVVAPGVSRLAGWVRKLSSEGREEEIQRRLEVAGSPTGWTVERILALKLLGVLLGVILGLFGCFVTGTSILASVGITIALGVVGFFSPNMALYQVGYQRRERLRRELPDGLDLLTISVEAGLTFDAALSQVARNTTGTLAEEFFRVLQEMQFGLGRVEAMRALGERSDLPELKSFVSAMIQADSFGVPIAHVLRVQAKEMRVKRTQRAEELAQQVPVKILFPLIFCILPALFMVVVGPAGISIFRNFANK